jgi:DNA-binding winged helix-turn-helix (wHTH) protein
MRPEIKSLFLLGNYKEVLAASFNQGSLAHLQPEDFKWVVGALCFTGRKEEAEALFTELSVQADPLSKAAGQFFLGVAFCRHGHYQKARGFFFQNFKEHRKSPGECGFYAWQGLSFYRYFCTDLKKSEKAALISLTRATLASFAYGRVLALDIIGHSLVQQGHVSAGLDRLDEARKTSEGFGNSALANSIKISSLVYRAQYGWEPRTIIRDLQKAHATLDTQNSYGQANLLLELANQYILRGKIERASSVLNQASTLIYGSQHRRYEHLLALRFAEVAYRKGEFAQALNAVRMQRSALDEKYDRVNLLMATGLEIKLLKALRMNAQIEILSTTLSRLTRQTARSISKNMVARQNERSQPSSEDDRIEKLFFSLNDKTAIHTVLRTTYGGLVYEAMNFPLGSSWILASKKELLVLDKGEVTRHPYRNRRIPEQLLRLLKALADGFRPKQDLIQKIWGYSYHPLHHDPMLYQAISHLREALGSHSQLIEVSEEGYRLRKGMGFAFLFESEESRSSEEKFVNKLSSDLARAQPLSLNLNERQVRILAALQRRQFMGVRECSKRFKTSTMTLKRDFAALMRGGWVLRIGRARATRYTLPNWQDSSTFRNEKGD